MKIIEALKKLKVIEKKIDKNILRIEEYASILNIERPMFESEDKQKAEVNALLQANKDLVEEYIRLKNLIDKTNQEIMVTISGDKYSVASLLIIKRKLAFKMMSTFNALNMNTAQNRLRMGLKDTDGKTPQVIMMYSEDMKYRGLQKWQELDDEIESRLEVINATTDLLE